MPFRRFFSPDLLPTIKKSLNSSFLKSFPITIISLFIKAYCVFILPSAS